jgi:hypothetical protein
MRRVDSRVNSIPTTRLVMIAHLWDLDLEFVPGEGQGLSFPHDVIERNLTPFAAAQRSWAG